MTIVEGNVSKLSRIGITQGSVQYGSAYAPYK